MKYQEPPPSGLRPVAVAIPVIPGNADEIATLLYAALGRIRFYELGREPVRPERLTDLAVLLGQSPDFFHHLSRMNTPVPNGFERQLKSRAFRSSVCRLIESVKCPGHLATILAALGLTRSDACG